MKHDHDHDIPHMWPVTPAPKLTWFDVCGMALLVGLLLSVWLYPYL